MNSLLDQLFSIMLIIVSLFALTQGYKPPRSCFYCVDGQESDCVRTKASMRWEEEGCGQLNIPANCTNMAEIMVGLGEGKDDTEKLITACGIQLGQCQVCSSKIDCNCLSLLGANADSVKDQNAPMLSRLSQIH